MDENKKKKFLKRQCGECGEGNFKFVNGKNTFKTPWKDFSMVLVSVDIELLQCQYCGNFVTLDAEKLDAAIESSLRNKIQ